MACNITGKKPSQLNDPAVPITLDNSWLVLETSDGKVCRVRPSVLEGLGNEVFLFVVADFAGTIINVPLSINGGKLPVQDSKVEVYTNGSMDYPVEEVDYTILRNAGVDQIQFTNPRNGDDILIKFTV